ncbi:uncharacterized protein LOC144213746 isoform X1 [Stigmatopora nigra]
MRRQLLLKVLVIGDLGVGKTSIIKRYVHRVFSQGYRATVGVDFALKVLQVDQATAVRLQLWDIAGQERYGNMTRVYYKEAVGALVVFDMTRLATFQAVLKWKGDLDSKVKRERGGGLERRQTCCSLTWWSSGDPERRQTGPRRPPGQQVRSAALGFVRQAAQTGQLLQGSRLRGLLRDLGQGRRKHRRGHLLSGEEHPGLPDREGGGGGGEPFRPRRRRRRRGRLDAPAFGPPCRGGATAQMLWVLWTDHGCRSPTLEGQG